MTEANLDIEFLRAKYREEQQKRLRPDGIKQYRELKDEYGDFDRDPYADPHFTRLPVREQTHVVIVGGGFAGMLTAINLGKLGITDVRIVEKAGDFGGTWYWNRYPGCMCDVESYTYLPLLEETGYMPTEKYASAPEIFAYCQLMGRHFDLYSGALFQTTITGAEWDDTAQRWRVSTDRGDVLEARFLVTAGGILSKAKLAGVPGLETFTGTTFHTSRWNYAFTGGAPGQPMDQLTDKRVGIVGTGATAIQAVPRLAEAAKEVFVFQRTPSAVGVRGNGPTDVEWYRSLKPGWQQERIINFTQSVTGKQPAQNLVGDGWTNVMWVNTQADAQSEQHLADMERSDFATMEAIRQRVDEIVQDPETAAKLKPWYGKNCKRMCFHDEYLPAFNRPNVHLVDTEGQGVEQVTANGVIVDGEEYPLDCLIFASGFEVTTDLDRRLGFDPIGRDGATLGQRWSQGPRTLHGVLSGGFPNLMIISLVQAGFGTNFVHFIGKSAEHVASIIATCRDRDIVTIEPTEQAEDDWLMVLYGVTAGPARYVATCTPGFYNNEQGAIDAKGARNLVYAGSLLDYAGYLERWREEGSLAGTSVKFDDASNG